MSAYARWTFESFVISLLLLLTVAVKAQDQTAAPKISVGFVMGFPTGKTAKTYVNGYGASTKVEFKVTKHLNLTGSAGYMTFRYRDEVKKRLDYLGEPTSMNGVVPIKVGAKYYLEGIYYAALELGSANTLGDRLNTSFAYGPTLGASIPISKHYSADLGLRYEGWKSSEGQVSFFGLRLALAISGTKNNRQNI